MNYNVLKDSIAAVIKANGNEEITGDLLQQVLLSMVNILGSGYQFMGAAVPTTNPGTPDARVFYIATQAGTYANFGSPAIVLDGTQIAVLLFASSWTPVVLSVPTKEYVDTALASKVDKVEGKGLSTNDLTDALVELIGGAFQKEDIEQDLGDSTTKVVSQAAITAVLLQYAKVDGYYSQLTAGAAENLVGRGSVPASFLRRTTGGTADVGTGSAKIAKLMGNSIVWNQLVRNGNFDNADSWQFDGNGSVSNNEATIAATSSTTGVYQQSVPIINGHKYLIKCYVKVTELKSVRAYFGTNTSSGIAIPIPATNQYVKGAGIVQASQDYTTLQINVYGLSAGGTITIKKINLIDLTKMFGAGKEPTTVAEFEALFPLDYYANEPGKVLPFAAQKLVTTGFNQWDEEWESGYINNNTGQNEPSEGRIRSKNYIPIFPNTAYFYKATSADIFIRYYDADKNYIGSNNGIHLSAITSPANARYMRFSVDGTTYNNDICINLSWSGYRNGEYEPYELHEAIFDPANWEDANGNKIFPYGGMHGVGTARDFATPDTDGFIRKGTRVFGRVDLGGLNWGYASTYQNFEAAISIKEPDDVYTPANMVCEKYIAINMATFNNTSPDKTMGYLNTLRIRDLSFNGDAAAFKAAMSGVYLYFELATPVETELAEPVSASYYANDFGTEEWQPANTDVPYTAPCDMNVTYAMNAVDTLRRLPENYISVGSFENFCTELATKLGAALNKTITITPTYDSEDAEYDYAITIADIEE